MWLTRPLQERSTQVFLGVLFAAVALVTLLHLIMPEGHALHVSAYTAIRRPQTPSLQQDAYRKLVPTNPSSKLPT
jgi:hypothetical protein